MAIRAIKSNLPLVPVFEFCSKRIMSWAWAPNQKKNKVRGNMPTILANKNLRLFTFIIAKTKVIKAKGSTGDIRVNIIKLQL